MSENVGASTSRNPKGPHGLYRDNFTFTISVISLRQSLVSGIYVYKAAVTLTPRRNYAGNKQKSYKIMKIQMFAILDKANPDTSNITDLNLAAVKHTTVQVTRLLL
jgi:hypothetical protein